MIEYLQRDAAPFNEALWAQIDAAVTDAARNTLVGRRFLPLYGPLGGGMNVAHIDAPGKEETFDDGYSVMTERTLAQIPQIYHDFWLYWRDLEYDKRNGIPVDLSAAREAGQDLANLEDKMVFYGIDKLGVPGLLNAPGVIKQKIGNWAEGDGAFQDIARAVATLRGNNRIGRYTVVLSLDMFVNLQRIVPGTGVMESDRVAKIVGERLFYSSVLQPGTAAVLCAQAPYMDLVVGQDIRTAYTESVDLNHHLRVLETALIRVKSPDAVVVLGK